MSSSNITITVRVEQVGKPINYSNPALVISTDCLVVDNYKDNNKDNIKFKEKQKYKDNYNDKDFYKDKDKIRDNANNKNK